MAEKLRRMDFAPTIPTVPINDFSKLRLTHGQMVDAWKIVGPSVERNINRGPLWQSFVAAYLEGLEHGYMAAQKRKDKA